MGACWRLAVGRKKRNRSDPGDGLDVTFLSDLKMVSDL
jgi:hypothetical protein